MSRGELYGRGAAEERKGAGGEGNWEERVRELEEGKRWGAGWEWRVAGWEGKER